MSLKILLVDDSQTVRAVIRRTLDLAGIPVEDLGEAENGRDALDILKQDLVNLVITDINMPVMGGLELISRMQSDPSLAEIPVVVVTTEGSSARIEELKRLGVKAYVRKPFTPEQIRTVIDDLLGTTNEN